MLELLRVLAPALLASLALQGCATHSEQPQEEAALRGPNSGVLADPDQEIRRIEDILDVEGEILRMRELKSDTKVECETCVRESWRKCTLPKLSNIKEFNALHIARTGENATVKKLEKTLGAMGGPGPLELFQEFRSQLTMGTWISMLHLVFEPCAKDLAECTDQCPGPEGKAFNVAYKGCELCALVEEKIDCPFQIQSGNPSVAAYIAQQKWTEGTNIKEMRLQEWMDLQHRLTAFETEDEKSMLPAIVAEIRAEADRKCSEEFVRRECAGSNICPAEAMDEFRAQQQAQFQDEVMAVREAAAHARGEHDIDDHNDPTDEMHQRLAMRGVGINVSRLGAAPPAEPSAASVTVSVTSAPGDAASAKVMAQGGSNVVVRDPRRPFSVGGGVDHATAPSNTDTSAEPPASYLQVRNHRTYASKPQYPAR